MISLPALLALAHLLGLVWAVGAATVKVVLLLRCRSDAAFVPVYARIVRPVTRQIVLGLILLTVSGIGFILIGHEFTPRLITKLVLVGVIWVLGPIIDNVTEPRFQKLAPAPGEPVSPAFVRIRRQHLALELTATGLFYVIIAIWMLA